jgi:hypothetical protein
MRWAAASGIPRWSVPRPQRVKMGFPAFDHLFAGFPEVLKRYRFPAVLVQDPHRGALEQAPATRTFPLNH